MKDFLKGVSDKKVDKIDKVVGAVERFKVTEKDVDII